LKEKEKMKSVVIIRRIIAIFLLFSTIQGVISDYEEGIPFNETIGGVALMTLIIFFLVKPPKEKNKKFKVEDLDYEEIDEAIIIEETFDNMETSEVEENEEYLGNLPSEDLESNYEKKREKSRNPIKDKQSLISRIFQGKTDRY
jgi:hypothetical protein